MADASITNEEARAAMYITVVPMPPPSLTSMLIDPSYDADRATSRCAALSLFEVEEACYDAVELFNGYVSAAHRAAEDAGADDNLSLWNRF